MRDEGCERAVLWTVGDREATMAFYAARGWRPDGRRATERGAELVGPGQGADLMLVAVTDHAVERFRQRVAGSLDARADIIRRVAQAVEAGRMEERGRGTVHVRDLRDRSLVYVCRPGAGELVVITLWEEEGRVAPPRVPRRFTDALERRRDR